MAQLCFERVVSDFENADKFMIKKMDDMIKTELFYLQNDESLNIEEAWPVADFPESQMHFFRESGCVVTSLFNMMVSWDIDLYETPWDFNEDCKKKGLFYPTANIELTKISEVCPVNYEYREPFDENKVRLQIKNDNLRCLVKVKGKNSRYHYILALASDDDFVFMDPAEGLTDIGAYDEYYETIWFSLKKNDRDNLKYYIAADGGGSKTDIVLYDEGLKIVSFSETEGTNSIFVKEDEIRESFRKTLKEMIPDHIKVIEGADLSIMKYEEIFLDELKKICKVKSYYSHTESSAVLASAGLEYGITALSGTGSAVMAVCPDKFLIKGGTGFLIGDEGSGFDIGSKSIRAAINAEEGHGPKTLMSVLIKEKYNLKSLRRITNLLYAAKNPTAEVASLSRLTGEAAQRGDSVAVEILKNAGHEMAVRVLACIEECGGPELPIVAGGGGWKGNGNIMFDSFCREVRAKYPEADITKPDLKPVYGCIIRRKMLNKEYSAEMPELLK